MKQMELEFQALCAGLTDLLSRFYVCDSNFKGRIILSQSLIYINRSPTLPNVSLHVPDLSTNLSLASPTASYVSCDENDPNGNESSTNDATVQSLPDSLIVVSPESFRLTNRSPAVATSWAPPHIVLPLTNTLAPPPFPLTSMIARKNTLLSLLR